MPPTTPVSIARLLAAMRRAGEFPAMAQTVGQINTLTASEVTSQAALAGTILHDYGMTQKVLQLANAVGYAQREPITTISRAVLLMGFERVHRVASGLVMFDHLHRPDRSAPLIEALNMSFFSANLGRTLAEDSGAASGEEAFICSLFHRQGHLLVAFYLPSDFAAIQALDSGTLNQRARHVLGMTFDEIGLAVAGELKLPEKLSGGLVQVSGRDPRQGPGADSPLGSIAILASDITETMALPADSAKKRAAIVRLIGSYRSHFEVTAKVDDLIAASAKALNDAAPAAGTSSTGSPFLSALRPWHTGSRPAARMDGSGPAGTSIVIGRAGTPGTTGPAADSDPATSGRAGTPSPEAILSAGLDQFTAALGGDYVFEDVLTAAFETMCRALGPGKTRVFFLLNDSAMSVARFRFGVGHSPDDETLLAEVPIRGSDDVFSFSFTRQRDVVIRDTAAAEAVRSLPAWYTGQGMPGRFMVLLPLILAHKCVGLIYVDGPKYGGAVLTPEVVNCLKLLRKEAVQAVRQKASLVPTRW